MNSKNKNNKKNIPDLEIIDLDLESLNDLPESEEGAYEEPYNNENQGTFEEPYSEENQGAFTEPYSEENQDAFTKPYNDESENIYSNNGTDIKAPQGQAGFDEIPPKTVDTDWTTELDEEYEEAADKKKFIKPTFFLHILFLFALVLIFFLIINSIRNYGRHENLDDYEGNYDPEVLDSIMPLLPQDGVEIVDDGVTTIVAFGNAPFADDRDSEDSLANIIEDMTGAKIYNVAVQDSYLAAEGATLSSDIAPMDAFNFYWLTTAFCLRNNDFVYEDIFKTLGAEIPQDGLEAYELLMDIDFSTVDVIAIMYDGSDYLAGHGMYSDANDTDIQQFTGNMCAGIDLIKATFPHIRIIVMSPTYAFAINEKGEYVSSDQYRYGQDVLSTYVIKQFGYSYDRSVTFVDNLYGTINEDDAPKYLTDHIHLNVEGRKKVAERFVYALNYYKKTNE